MKRIFYCSCQTYSFELAKLLEANLNWKPVYWFTGPHNQNLIESDYPNTTTHRYLDSVKGILPLDFDEIDLLPVDSDDILTLSHEKDIALAMMDRNDSNSNSFSHRQREAFFNRMLRYWKTTLIARRIDIVLFEEEPHQASDYILYSVCKLLDIETIMPVRTIHELGLIPMHRFENGSKIVIDQYQENLKTHADQLSLPPKIEAYFEKLKGDYRTVQKIHLWNQVDNLELLSKELGFTRKISRFASALLLLLKKVRVSRIPRTILFILNIEKLENDQIQTGRTLENSKTSYLKNAYRNYRTKQKKKRNKKTYLSLANEHLDLKTDYIFCALQYQPEKSTCPLADCFVDQYLMIESLSKRIPKGWKLYIKDHPSQFIKDFSRYGETFRSKQYYMKILNLGNTELVPLDFNTFHLIDNAKAVASAGGTVCWESVVRGIPAFTFAYTWFRTCEGVYDTMRTADLEKALQLLIKGEISIEHKKVRLFAKTICNLDLPAAVGGPSQLAHRGLTAKENAAIHFRLIVRLLVHSKALSQ